MEKIVYNHYKKEKILDKIQKVIPIVAGLSGIILESYVLMDDQSIKFSHPLIVYTPFVAILYYGIINYKK